MSSIESEHLELVSHVHVCIVGGGPAGLAAAEVISGAGHQVHLYDAMPSVGRKFLMAGKGGLNLTHSEDLDAFLPRYGPARAHIEPMLRDFGPQALRDWARDLGVETFVGTSGRVFPADFKAAPLLRAWLHRLREAGVSMHVRHTWRGWDQAGNLLFEAPQATIRVCAEVTVFAMGGGSWARLGSDAAWVPLFEKAGVPVAPLRPANCGFDVHWSAHFKAKFAGAPIKAVAAGASCSAMQPGEFVVTETGVEGSLIYALSALLRDSIAAQGSATLHLDLAPGRQISDLVRSLERVRGKQSLANHLRQRAGIQGVKASLLREVLSTEEMNNPDVLASTIKCLPIRLVAAGPLDEAISTAGGVRFEALADQLMVRTHPGVFCAGEMLDWEAPTGGYLLTACMASGRLAGRGVVKWLARRPDAAK